MTYSGKHAQCYDLFYEHKPYHAEAEYASALIRARFPAAKTILDLGCGTGLRCLELARQGYNVGGVDQSASMLDEARHHLAAARDILPGRVEFQEGDITTFLASSKYDAVVSLFHVFSYLTTEVALKQAIDCSFANLNPGGVFLFDYWHGPGVLNDPPGTRTRLAENSALRAVRTSVPTHLPDRHFVKLSVRLEVTEKIANISHHAQESYLLRYWFPEELEHHLKNSRFKQIHHFAWMMKSPPSSKSWQACTVAVKP
jgi:SAM-dependent methyltransferase